ncbi:5921_t:CDS:2 [Entrophospora sp. SA101]|nr:3059_t:CDS:2 [Entrophospora sp. SA101]CAJ0635140.1 5921_t:CDS:2 [Entrophospora sp. SA101]
MSGCNRKRRLSKLPTPVIIPPPSPSSIISTSSSSSTSNTLINNVVNGCLSSPISPAKSDSFFDLPASPRNPHSPTKRFVLKPINAITAALQRTTITGSNNSIRKKLDSPTTRKFRQPKSSTCKKALPIVPAELAERLRESYPSFNSNTENENELEKAAEENKMYSLSSLSTTIKPSLKPILIDVRNLALYENEHICESFNVNLPTLLIKRYRRGSMSNFSLDSFITTPEGLFDETMNENDKVSPGWTLLSVLERVMMSNNDNLLETPDPLSPMDDSNRGRVYWLKGGFEAFKSWDKKGEFIMSEGYLDSISNSSLDVENQGASLVRRDSLFSVNTERNSLRRKKNLTPSILVTNLDSSNRNDDLDLDSPCTPPPITHPEVAFDVSTIVPDFLFLGPEITKEEEVEELESKGIRRILNMAFECEDNLGLNQKFEKYLKVSVKDLVEEDVENGLKLAVDFIDQAYNDNTPIYVHCKAGKSRSVTAVLAYLIKSRHWTLRHAYDYVMERRSGICPNIGFVAELMRVEEGVLGHKRVNGAMTHVGFRRKDNMLDMESINSLGNIPRTAFF